MTKLRPMASLCMSVGFLCLLTASVAFGQSVTGSISGTVKDSTGAVVPLAQVVVLNDETGNSRTIISDPAGRYLASLLAPGNYKVTATLQGFQTMVRSGIVLTLAQDAIVDLTLQVGAATQTVEVTGEASAVETTSATVSSLIASEQIRELPLNGRSLTDLALLSPSVFYNRTTGNSQGDGFGPRLTVAGARSEMNLFLIDGAVANNRTGQTATTSGASLGVEGIREFRIISHNFSAEYGRNSGGVITMVTRSGTNQFHGSLYEFVRNNIFDARDFFNTTSSKPAFRRNQYGGAVGGPVIKDRIFFFSNYEGLRQRQVSTFVNTVPDANARKGILPTGNVTVSPLIQPYLNNLALWPLPNGQNFGDGTGRYLVDATTPINEGYYLERGDFHLSDKDSVYLRYIYNPSQRLRLQPLPNFVRPDDATAHNATLGHTHLFSPSIINEFRFGYIRTSLNTSSQPTIPIDHALAFDPLTSPSVGMGQISFSAGSGSASGGLSAVGSKNGPGLNYNNAFQYTDSVSMVRGSHSIKFGIDFQRNQFNSTSLPGGGEYVFAGLAGLLAATPSELNGSRSDIPNFPFTRGFRETLIGYYFQDDYRLRPNLTLNFGIRHEFQLDRFAINGLSGSFLNVLTDTAPTPGPSQKFAKLNFAPRVGLAWDPTGKGKTSIRVGAGVYHNQVTGSALPNTPNSLATTNAFIITNPTVFPHGFPTGPPAAAGSNPAIAATQWPLPTPTALHFSLDVQQQLTSTFVARLGYVGTNAYNQTRLTQQNIRGFTIQNGDYFWAAGNPPRLNPAMGNISQLRADSISNYHALQATLQKSLGTGLMFSAAYTWGKTMSEADSVSNRAIDNSGPFTSLDKDNPGRDYALSGYDQRHTFVANGQYRLPFDRYLTNGFTKTAFGGWTIKGIWQYGSGMPVDVFLGFANSRNGQSGSAERPNLLPGFSNNPTSGVTVGCGPIPAGQNLGTPDRWFDPCAFGLSPAGTWGNLGRNTVAGPNYNQVNFTLAKDTKITESVKLEFRAEAFNFLNHPSFGLVQGSVITGRAANGTPVHSGNEGTISSTASQSRQIQLGLRLIF